MPPFNDTEKKEVWNQAKKCYYPITLFRLRSGETDELMRFQELAEVSMEDKSLFVPLSENECAEVLGENGITLGIRVRNKLIAFYSALFPGKAANNLGYDLNLSGGELDKVCHLEIAFVHPDYRNNGLQVYLGKQVVEIAKKQYNCRYLCATVHPFNIPALHNALGLGLQIVWIKGKYGGLKRFILFRDLLSHHTGEGQNTLKVKIDDITRQKELLKKGCRGLRVIRKDKDIYAEYIGEVL